MGNLGKDAKDLLIGKDGSEKEPDDFKPQLQKAIKTGEITKADGTLLITARDNSDKLGDNINKKQIDAARKIKDDELYDSAEEELEAMKKKEEKKKKEEERKRKQRAAEVARKQTEKTNKLKGANKKEATKEPELSKTQKERGN